MQTQLLQIPCYFKFKTISLWSVLQSFTIQPGYFELRLFRTTVKPVLSILVPVVRRTKKELKKNESYSGHGVVRLMQGVCSRQVQ